MAVIRCFLLLHCNYGPRSPYRDPSFGPYYDTTESLVGAFYDTTESLDQAKPARV